MENILTNLNAYAKEQPELIGMLKMANAVRTELLKEMNIREHKDVFLNSLFDALNAPKAEDTTK